MTNNIYRVVFPLTFMAKAIEVYPKDMNLHIAVANGDYRTVKCTLYDYLGSGFEMNATKLLTLQPDELYNRARIRKAREDLYDTCAMFLNSYWATPTPTQ